MAARTADAFAARFGRTPAGVWAGPGRVNLIGEHTDYNGGFVLPFAIDKTTTAALAVRGDRTVRVASALSGTEAVEVDLDGLRPGAVTGWAAYPLGVAWALEQAGVRLPGFDLLVDSDVPVGAGLSSSAALECAVAVGLAELAGLDGSVRRGGLAALGGPGGPGEPGGPGGLARLDRRALAAVGRRAENDMVGAPTGIMDQYASLFGAAGSAVFLDCRSEEVQLVPLELDAAGLVCLVLDTKVSHAHATGDYARRRDSCTRAAEALGVPLLREVPLDRLPEAQQLLDEETFRRARHIVAENQRVVETVKVLRSEGPAAIGRLLDASHGSMRDDFEISCPELDLAVDTAQANGALGARMTGGGFGGSAIALVPVGDLDKVRDAVLRAFASRRYRQPELFTVLPADGARRLL
ncbi:galactokinase [Arthrobacter sp. CAU 1506]|uniref:galactokinase n=1 Tax=Arthrobacter sp. CAU 1506 TaxID=2560052 RepID=UPI0010AD18C0|nr:galactokinase [Arthrobacter sp. CAU 1506]TJY72647.1 galactokinase [Arthrobacter sp. CAU 1506]